MSFENFELRRNKRAKTREYLFNLIKDFSLADIYNLKLQAGVVFVLSMRYDELNEYLSVITKTQF